MSDTNLVLVRHPRTPDKQEKQDRNTGHNKTGTNEAYGIAKKIAQLTTPTQIFSSEYLRAQIPAFILRYTLGADLHDVTVDPIFNEIDRPLVDGRPFTSLSAYFQWRKNIFNSPTEENIRSRFRNTGESYWQLFERAKQIHQIFHLPQFRGKRNIVYSHSQLIAMIRSYDRLGPNPTAVALMETFNELFPDYCSITTIEIY